MNKPPPVIDKRMPEPMEVDHFLSQQRCYSCGNFSHLARHCRGQERVGSPSRMHYPENRRNYGGSLPKCITQKIGEITVILAIPQVDKANLVLGDLIIREAKTLLS